jgi:hypothetical protein
MSTHHLIFNPGSVVRFGGNNFIDVPIILQVGDTPIVETVKEHELSRTTSFSIFNSDGVYFAKVVGPRLFLTSDGEKANLTLRHPDKLTVCEMGGKTLFEVRRETAAALAITAELYSPAGLFVKATASIPFGSFSKDGTQIGGAMFSGNTVTGCRVGYWLKADGGLGFGCG